MASPFDASLRLRDAPDSSDEVTAVAGPLFTLPDDPDFCPTEDWPTTDNEQEKSDEKSA